MYPIGALSVGATPVAAPERDLTADVDALLERVTERTRIIFIANPNNPTGTYLPISEMRRLHAGLPTHVLLAIDAAYAEFVNRNDFDPGVSLVDRAENVVMLRTFSKIYALAGLRLGWAYCPPAIADVLNRIRGPFNVTAPRSEPGSRQSRIQRRCIERRRTTNAGCPGCPSGWRRSACPDPERREFRAAALSGRPRAQRRRRFRVSAISRHPGAQDGGLWTAAASADHDRHRGRNGEGRRGPGGIHGSAARSNERPCLIGLR